jgi:outer membrane receptor protein involved in Fe transport
MAGFITTPVNTAGAQRTAAGRFRRKLLSSAALGAAIGAMPAGAAHAQAVATSQTPPPRSAEPEIVTVTAQRRVQNLQDVPVSVQVLSGATLKRLNVENFDDLIGQLPNVTATGFGPGQESIYIRGLNLGGAGSQESGILGSFPNVAVYLDDQSAQVPGRNLDIYAADLQQVEVLEGPQGTLFGSGAQAGVVRYITNKPDLSRFGGNIDVGGALTAHGNPSGNIDATINIPIVKDQIAIRITGYDDKRGGYINNVPGTFVREATDLGIPRYAGYTVPGPPNATNSINNFNFAKKDINPVTYEGFRAELAWKFNEDWNALLTESAQRMDAQGVFYEEPYTSGSNPVKLPDLSVQNFEPSFDEDQFENTALTVNGRLGALNLVYSGAYLIRHVTQQQDYTNYARGIYADYYQCVPANAAKGTKAHCYSPGAIWDDHDQDSHLSQEFRVSTPSTWRLRAIGGFYYEDFKVAEQTNFDYRTAPGFALGPPPGSGASDPYPRAEDTGFFADVKRGYTQYAAFGSVDFDIIPDVLIATAGTRWFDFYDYERGYVDSGFFCGTGIYAGLFPESVPCHNNAHDLDKAHLKNTSYGFKSRANLTYKITPDIMVYYTWSQGYRPGGYNRTSVAGLPYFFGSDNLTNNEVGYKASLLNHTLILDGAFYVERWDNVQAEIFDPGVFGNLAFTTNGPNYRVLGLELQATDRPIDALTLNTSIALNDSKRTTSPLFDGTQLFGAGASTLAQSPAFKASFRARYEWADLPYSPFVQLALTHSSHEHSAAAGTLISLSPDFYKDTPIFNFFQGPITSLDVSAGASFGAWSGNIYCNNITNERGQEFISATQFVQSVIVDRPLTAGVKLSYRF